MSYKYTMSLSLNVLNHLGINLYSNIPSVISEIVANSWDADAKNVDINIDNNEITISDDGCGMTCDDINDHFLRVGYQKRTEMKASPTFSRPFMGRRVICYSELIENAFKSYNEFIRVNNESQKMLALMNKLEIEEIND